MQRADVLIIGAGMAGASAAFFLKSRANVIVLERESQPGYHTTGRSAAMFIETYGNRTVRALTKASEEFFHAPPPGFADAPLVSPRGALVIARPDQMPQLERAYGDGLAITQRIFRCNRDEALSKVPILRGDYFGAALFEPDAQDIDVAVLHRGFLRGLTAAGGKIITNTEVTAMAREGDGWRVETPVGAFAAPIVVNAAGAWCDHVARLAGIAPIGLEPKRRTAITFDAPPEFAVKQWPIVIDVDERFYFKPDAGRILASPADETPSPPCDAAPEELDIAVLVDKLGQATDFRIQTIRSRWAGLRSFVADRSPVAGYSGQAPGFFWLAGQGGFGIQTAPAMGQIAATLIERQPIAPQIAQFGIDAAMLSPARAMR